MCALITWRFFLDETRGRASISVDEVAIVTLFAKAWLYNSITAATFGCWDFSLTLGGAPVAVYKVAIVALFSPVYMC